MAGKVMNEIQLGPVTVEFEPPEAVELLQVLGHILFNAPPPDVATEEQMARTHFLGQAALKLSAGIVQAMKDAGVPDEMIARVTGQIQASPQQVEEVEAAKAHLQEIAEEARGKAEEGR